MPHTKIRLSQEPKESFAWHSTPAEQFSIDIASSFERRNACQVRWSLGGNEPLNHSQPGVSDKRDFSIAPFHLCHMLDYVVSVTALLRAPPPTAV